MSLGFDRDVIVVTGGAGALGSAYCRLLAHLGARVVVNDTGGVVDGTGGDPEAAAEVVRAIEDEGGVALADAADGSDPEQAAALIANTIGAYGRVDAVIANAGILRDQAFHNQSDADFFAVVNAHLAGTVRVFGAAYPHMREQGYGRLVSTTSAAGLFGNIGQTAYAAAKMGIVGFTRSLALEGTKRNINANVIAPAARSRMTEELLPDDLARALAPEHVAPLAAYLCHRSCELTGEVISAGAGRFARVRIGVAAGVFEPKPTPDSLAGAIDDVIADDELLFPRDFSEEGVQIARAAGVGA